MFDFFKNDTTSGILAPVSGILIDLANVSDPVFSSKMMGDGFAIKPDDNKKSISVIAPVSGKIVSLPNSGHAFGIHTNDGVDVLVHVGIDTVKLRGNGFKVLRRKGEKVRQGENIINFMPTIINQTGSDDTVMLILMAGYDKKINLVTRYQQKVKAGEKILE